MEIPFVGRSTELETIVDKYQNPNFYTQASMIITGPPLIGKSALAREAASRICEIPRKSGNHPEIITLDLRKISKLDGVENWYQYLGCVVDEMCSNPLFQQRFTRGTFDVLQDPDNYRDEQREPWTRAMMELLGYQIATVSRSVPLVMVFDNYESGPRTARPMIETSLMTAVTNIRDGMSFRIITTREDNPELLTHEIRANRPYLRLNGLEPLELKDAIKDMPLSRIRHLKMMTGSSPGLIVEVLRMIPEFSHIDDLPIINVGIAGVVLETISREFNTSKMSSVELLDFLTALSFMNGFNVDEIFNLTNVASGSLAQVKLAEIYQSLRGIVEHDRARSQFAVNPDIRNAILGCQSVLNPEQLLVCSEKAYKATFEFAKTSRYSSDLTIELWRNVRFVLLQRKRYLGLEFNEEDWVSDAFESIIKLFPGVIDQKETILAKLKS